jgi:hypothetical protein
MLRRNRMLRTDQFPGKRLPGHFQEAWIVILAAAEMPSARRKGGMRKEMGYLDNLKTEANYTRTLNGAKTHGSTGDACLDFFAVAGGMRYRRPLDQINLFDRAYIETD